MTGQILLCLLTLAMAAVNVFMFFVSANKFQWFSGLAAVLILVVFAFQVKMTVNRWRDERRHRDHMTELTSRWDALTDHWRLDEREDQ